MKKTMKSGTSLMIAITLLAFLGQSRALNPASKAIKPHSYQDYVYGAVIGAALGNAACNQSALAVLDVFGQSWEILNQHNFSSEVVNKVMTELAQRCDDWGNTQAHNKYNDTVVCAWPIGLVMAWPVGQTKMIEYLAISRAEMTSCSTKSLAASAAIAVGISKAVMSNKLTPEQIVLEMIHTAKKYDIGTANLMAWAMRQAQDCKSDDVKFLNELQALVAVDGADEVMFATVYIFLKYANNLSLALNASANSAGDREVIATLVGALVGAYAGISSLADFQELEKLEQIDQLEKLASCIYQKHYARMRKFSISPNEIVFVL